MAREGVLTARGFRFGVYQSEHPFAEAPNHDAEFSLAETLSGYYQLNQYSNKTASDISWM